MAIPNIQASILNDVASVSNASFANNTVIGQYFNISSQSITSDEVDPVWFGMKTLVTVFIERDELNEILKAFLNDSNIPKFIVIAGLGGVGKSELALKFAYTYKDMFENLIWINAEIEQDLRTGFEQLASELKITLNTAWQTKQLVKHVYEHFKNKKSLFIFDNVESWKSGRNPIYDYLPAGLRPGTLAPNILITSRNRTWGLPVKVVPLDKLSVSQSVEYIKICLQLESAAEIKEAEKLADVLDCLPLALQQAVAYILREIQNPPVDVSLTIENLKASCIMSFVNRLGTREAELLNYKDEEGYGDGYEKTVLLTWMATFEKINDINRQAIELMAMISYLRPDNIILTMLSTSDHISNQELEKAVAILFQYSMIKREVNIISVHRLVQKVVRIHNRENEEYTLLSLLNLFSKILDENPSSNSISHWLISCLSHAHFVWEHSLIYSNLLSRFEDFAALLFDESDTCGMYHSNLSLLYKTLDKFGELDEMTIKLKTRLVTTLWRIDMFEKAVSVGDELYTLISLEREQDDPLLLDLLSTIVIAHSLMGDYHKALTIYESLITSYVTSLNFGPNHADTRSNIYNKADVLRKLGRFGDALEIFQSELSVELKKEKPDEIFALDLESQIAYTLHWQDNYKESLQIHRKVYDKRKSILGEEHDFTISSAFAIAECLCDLKKWDEAMDVLDVKADDINPTDNLIKQHLIGRILKAKGRIGEAVNVLRSALGNCVHVSENNWQLLNTKHFLGELLETEEMYDEALELYKNVHEGRLLSLGAEHTKSKQSEECLRRLKSKITEKHNIQRGSQQIERPTGPRKRRRT